ncbi:MAG: hypothetical protein KJ067_06540 [Vicinamibacteria bacterium]|nr:hypothetical protein [Vicinamibacteria bacterium]
MCSQVSCPRCGRPTWAGCGQHIEQALRGVPQDKRCQCPRPEPPPRRGFFGFGR